jgi:arylsulfatase A-like enzyme
MNIILIISDTFRYDNLFNRASMPVHTPNLDAFASRAISFTNFYTGSFPTIPQRTDAISGRTGWPWYGWQDLNMSSPNALPLLLTGQGYVTQLICDCPHLFNSGFQKTFDAACAIRGQEGDLYLLNMNHKIPEVMAREKTRSGVHFQGHNLVNLHRWTNRTWNYERDTFPPRTAETAVQWLEDNYKFKPFLLWVDFFDPHEPWDAPDYLVQKYDPNHSSYGMLHPNYGKADDYTQEELVNLRAHYCAEAELVDRWIGRILEKIDDLNLWDNSIVIFTTDHGISLGEHNRTGKTNINDRDKRFWPIYPEIAHIPFMVALPGYPGNIEVEAIAQPADILPTLFDLIGKPDITTPQPLHGRSFAPVLSGGVHHRDFAISSQFINYNLKSLAAEATTPVLYTAKWAFVPVGPQGDPELFDWTNDPLCMDNVLENNPIATRQLKDLFISWLEEMDAPHRWWLIKELNL